jgi:hypothetical protein
LLDGRGGGGKNRKKQKKIVYRHDWLVDEAQKGYDDDIQTLQDIASRPRAIYEKTLSLCES